MVLYGTTSRIKGFDPVKTADVDSAMAIGNIYEGLLQYSYLARPYKVEPLLAESMPEVSTNGLIYTFKIRKGIFFQDDPCFTNNAGKGRELVAEDFVYSIKRLADLKTGPVGYWVFEDRIVGLDEFKNSSAGKNPTDYSRPVEGLRTPGSHVLEITLTKPYPQLLWVLTMQYGYMVPREAVEYYGKEFVNHPVGTGPYVLKAWSRNYRVEFVRNPKWAQTGRGEKYPQEGEPGDGDAGLLADAGRNLPIVDRIVNFVVDDSTTQWLKFVTGELESSGVSRDNWSAVIMEGGKLTKSLTDKGVRLYSRPTLDVYYIGFNMDDPVVGGNRKKIDKADSPGDNAKVADDPAVDKNRKLRQALTCAFNSKEWIKYWNDRVVRARGPIPPGVAGFEEKDSPYPFDVEKARKLLAEAGYADGKDPATGRSLTLTVEIGSADPQTREAAELVGRFMKEIGVILKPSFNNWPTFLSKMERRQCQMYWLGWVADYPDAENFLQLFCGKNSSPGPNHSNYANQEYDRLYETISTMPDSPERTQLYRKMADMIIEDCPWIFMHHPVSYGLHHTWVRNYKPHDFPYGTLKYRRIDTEKRTQWRSTFGRRNWRD